jgi:hypothetical protein
MFHLTFLLTNDLFGVVDMPTFQSFIARHGEFAVQALIERIERYDGMRSADGSSLEERWKAVMGSRSSADQSMAA